MRARVAALLIGAGLLAACGAGPGDPASGQQLFNGTTPIAEGNVAACVTCHTDRPDKPSPLGPDLSNIGNRAERTVAGQSAEEYLRTAIIDPDAYLSGGFQEGIMPRTYRQSLSEQQINDLVAYLLTLRSGQD